MHFSLYILYEVLTDGIDVSDTFDLKQKQSKLGFKEQKIGLGVYFYSCVKENDSIIAGVLHQEFSKYIFSLCRLSSLEINAQSRH